MPGYVAKTYMRSHACLLKERLREFGERHRRKGDAKNQAEITAEAGRGRGRNSLELLGGVWLS